MHASLSKTLVIIIIPIPKMPIRSSQLIKEAQSLLLALRIAVMPRPIHYITQDSIDKAYILHTRVESIYKSIHTRCSQEQTEDIDLF